MNNLRIRVVESPWCNDIDTAETKINDILENYYSSTVYKIINMQTLTNLNAINVTYKLVLYLEII